jgi:hypothetical protein
MMPFPLPNAARSAGEQACRGAAKIGELQPTRGAPVAQPPSKSTYYAASAAFLRDATNLTDSMAYIYQSLLKTNERRMNYEIDLHKKILAHRC